LLIHWSLQALLASHLFHQGPPQFARATFT
jgi:hypothetical protein